MAFHDRAYNRDGGDGGFRGPGGPRMNFGVGRHSMTLKLIIACVAVLFLDAIFGRVQHGAFGGYRGGWLTHWGYFSFEKGVEQLQVWRLLTYQFLHADPFHLFFNMLALFFFGPMVEQHLGSRRFLGLYLISGLAGAVLYLLLLAISFIPGVDPQHVPLLLTDGKETMLVGASGCVLGVLVAAWRIAPDANVLLFFVIPIPMRVLIGLIILVDLWVVITGTDNAGGSAAHLGGAIAGFLLIRHANLLNFTERIDIERFRQHQQRRRRDREQRNTAAHEAEVDRILAKVKEHGLQSLTDREKRTLSQETERRRGG